MKYIDAEKLIAEIERQQRRLILLSHTEQVDMKRDCALQYGVYEDILATIASLQQERPECIYGRTLEERKKYCKFCSAICKARIEQEQPEWDLDSALTGFMGRYAYENSGEYPSAIDIAKHFYELGLNAGKK